MNTYTFDFSNKLSSLLGLESSQNPNLSDQLLDVIPDGFENYRTYGGGGSGHKNGHYGCKHSDEAKRLISQSKIGKPAHNKGKPNPVARERMLKNNPMKNPEVAKKASERMKGSTPWNKGIKTGKPAWNSGKRMPKIVKGFGKDGRKKTLWTFASGDIILSYDTRYTSEKLGLSYSSVRHMIGNTKGYQQGKYPGLVITRV